MTLKRKPHHNLAAVKAKFAEVKTLELTALPWRERVPWGVLCLTLSDIVCVVSALSPSHFIKSETAHSPPNSKIWHDSYKTPWDGRLLYLKFAGETLIDVRLTSFKEINNG